MAYYSKEQKRIILNTEEEEVLQECKLHVSRPEKERKSKTAEKIINWVLIGR